MSWHIGLAVASCGSLAGALGDNMVRKVYMERGSDAKAAVYLGDWMFVVGMLLTTVVDATSTVVALGFAPSSVVTPFAVVHIFLSIVIAKFWLKEVMGKWEYVGSSLLLSGVALIIFFAGKATNLRTVDSFVTSLATPPAMVYLLTVGFLVIMCMMLSSNFAAQAIPRYGHILQRFCTAAASGLLGGNTNVSAKAFTIVISTFFHSDINSYTDWRSYLIILSTGTLALLQVLYLNIGLRKYQAVYVIPITNSFLVSTGIMGGMMLLKEIPDRYGALSMVMIFFGLLIILIGILILSLKHSVSPLFRHEVKRIEEFKELHMGEEELKEAKAEHVFSFKQFTNSLVAISSNSIILSPCAYMTIHSLQDQLHSPCATTLKSARMLGLSAELQYSEYPRLEDLPSTPQVQSDIIVSSGCAPDDLPLIASEEFEPKINQSLQNLPCDLLEISEEN